ncbi:MAG: hypothetical protein AAFR39_04820 [Pseudomonadota bacterium]
MSDKSEKVVSSALVDAVRKVKIAAAERSDVVVDMKEADRARLEILAQHLRPVFDDVPVDDDRFDFAISSGLQPRLWIDATAHVLMGRDRRLYRFVRDTRMGRVTLAEDNAPEPVAEAITTYIAERLYERELAFAADDEISSLRSKQTSLPNVEKTEAQKTEAGQQPTSPDASGESGVSSPSVANSKPSDQTGASTAVLWLLGLFIAGGGLMLMYRDAIFAALQ